MSTTNPETRRRWYAKNAVEQRAKKRLRYANLSVEEKEKMRAYAKKWREEKQEYTKDYHRRARLAQYDLTPEEYEQMVIDQGETCALCGTDESGGRHGVWHVDHDHDTGTVRGLLCTRCNMGLGHFDDNIEKLQQAIDYLTNARKWKKKK